MTAPDSIRALIELAKKATPGEWRVTEQDDEFTESGCRPDSYVQAVCGEAWDNIAACGGTAYEDSWTYTPEQRRANAEFIAAARNAIPALEALLEQMPVAWLCESADGKKQIVTESLSAMVIKDRFGDKISPLYSSPHPEAASVAEPQAGAEVAGDVWEAAEAITESFIYRIPGATDATRIQYRREIAAIIRQHISEGKMPGWVKCSEKMPNLAEYVLIERIFSNGEVRVEEANWQGTFGWCESRGQNQWVSPDCVKRWMPMPFAAAPEKP